MKEQYLQLVEERDIEGVKNLFRMNETAAGFNGYMYYIEGKLTHLRALDLNLDQNQNNPLGLNIANAYVKHREEAAVPIPERSTVVIADIKDGLTQAELAAKIDYLRTKVAPASSTVVYSTWVRSAADIPENREIVDPALMIAAKNGHAAMVKLFLAGGFDEVKTTIVRGSQTELVTNSSFNRVYNLPRYKVNFLKANPNAQNQQGQSALQLAVQSGSKESVLLLLRYGSIVTPNDAPTYDFCKQALTERLLTCSEQEKTILKQKLETVFPGLFPAPEAPAFLWIHQPLHHSFLARFQLRSLALTQQVLDQNTITYGLIYPIINRMFEMLSVSRSDEPSNLPPTPSTSTPLPAQTVSVSVSAQASSASSSSTRLVTRETPPAVLTSMKRSSSAPNVLEGAQVDEADRNKANKHKFI